MMCPRMLVYGLLLLAVNMRNRGALSRVAPASSEEDFDEDFYTVAEGDIIKIISRKDDHQAGLMGNAWTADKYRWPNGTVFYYLSRGMTSTMRNRVREAMLNITIETNNCITFQSSINETAYVRIALERRKGCSAEVGRIRRRQKMQLDSDCQVHDIVHELLHVLGFFHEHTRPDRDNYVFVNRSNIYDSSLQNYDKRPENQTTQLNLPYDFASIMHYPPMDYGAAINKEEPVMRSVDPNIQLTTNRRLSKLDILKILRHYKCENRDTDICTITAGGCSIYHNKVIIQDAPGTRYRLWLNKFSGLRDCHKSAPNRVSVFCQNNATPLDASTIAGILRNRLEVTNYTLFVLDAVLKQNAQFVMIKEKVVGFWISTCKTDSATSRLMHNSFPNLIEFGVHNCSGQRVFKRDFAETRLLRRIVFHATTIAYIERDTFSELNALQLLQLEEWWLPRENGKARETELVSHAQRLHCSCDHQWLRDWFRTKPDLITVKKAGKVYPGSREVKVGEIYLSIDCTNVKLSVHTWANGHTTSASYNQAKKNFAFNCAPCPD
ncbi:uncharacterized protein LOC129600023 [Paramacrobiotus metropolitanus]|uniref:uncharacterized protein LOC129600023 n=1 Tax=Paramacrobiotus metropolitanus TaxID=2943436 RepID=UPI0024462217|nr:uncharacterized protein LOC129600023 [Paramacrobiotus metropolitanus]